MKLKTKILALCTVAALSAPALADNIVAYSYTGVVASDDANNGDGRGWVSFTGQLAFDRTATDSIADPSTAAYRSMFWPAGMNVTFDDGQSFSFSPPFDILVSNNLGGADQFGALGSGPGSADFLSFTLYDFTQNVFASDALPLPLGGLSLSSFQWSEFMFESDAGILQGHLTSLTCVSGCDAEVPPPVPSVPEPETYALMAAGLGVIGLVSRRRRSA